MEELERTYLAKEFPENLALFPAEEIVDVYLPSISVHPVLRIRRHGDIYEITKKRPISRSDSSRQIEETISLDKDEYKELITLRGKRLIKTRYYYKQNGVDFEIDVFQESLTGLVLVDVEFSSVEERNNFVKPPFCLADVTQENFIAGGMLCGKAYDDIEDDLNRLGYRKLSLL